jgi:ABC-type transport system involved in multi-copper enzyme maturation permease subunit
MTVDERALNPAPVAVPPTKPRGGPFGVLGRTLRGINAVGVKELRGRMRGRRAFVILTMFLILLGSVAWLVEVAMERNDSFGFGNSAATVSASVGQGTFVTLIMLETLLVAFLAPLATAGAISQEREKQTLEMLAVTPISSFAIVSGKLLSALVYVWLLIAASIPLTAIVFVFGGVAPEDVVRAYAILIVTALGFGALGLFCSSVVKRTQAATAISVFAVLALCLGSVFVLAFWRALVTPDPRGAVVFVRNDPPAVLAFVNPFMAQTEIAPSDALCTSSQTFQDWCALRSRLLPGDTGVTVFAEDSVGGFRSGPVNVAGPAPDVGVFVDSGVASAPNDVVPFGGRAPALWPSTIAIWLVLSVVFLVLSVQFVSPTRRWRVRRRRPETREAV